MTRHRLILALIFSILASAPAHAQDLVEQALRIPMHEAGKKGLEAVMVRPNEPGPHPLAVLSHGAPREAEQRPGMTPWGFIPQAREFARRGWVTVVVMRRGYGDSGGGYNEDARACSGRADYYDAGKESAKDLRATIAYLSTLPEVDASRIIAVGVSAGGFATVALTDDPPPGLVAGISFAGGRGSMKPDEVCNPGQLVQTFSEFGKKSRVPMLWVYSDNDHFFGPQIAAQFFEAFSAAGGKTTFIRAAAFRKDGHGLFSRVGIPIWTPMVDAFLSSQNLALRTALLALPTPPDVDAPHELSAGGREDFRTFLTMPPHKAFAVSAGGHYGYAFGRRTETEARKMAEDNCKDVAPAHDNCSVVATDESKSSN